MLGRDALAAFTRDLALLVLVHRREAALGATLVLVIGCHAICSSCNAGRRQRARLPPLRSPPLRPACDAFSRLFLKLPPLIWPPLRAISRRFSWSMAAKPRNEGASLPLSVLILKLHFLS